MPQPNTKPIAMPTDLATNQRLVHSPDRPKIEIQPADLNVEQRLVYLYDQVKNLLAGTPTSGTAPTTAHPGANNRPSVPAPVVTQPLTATGAGVQFSFSQINAANIAGYHIYRSADIFPNATQIDFIQQSPAHPSIAFKDTTPAGSVYYYWVTAVDNTGTESQPAAAQAAPVSSGSQVTSTGNLTLKNVAQGIATTAGPTTTSGAPVLIPEMTQTVTTNGNKLLILFNGTFQVSVLAGLLGVYIYRDGSSIGYTNLTSAPGASYFFPSSISFMDGPAAGSHTYEIRWNISSGTATAVGTDRALQIIELG